MEGNLPEGYERANGYEKIGGAAVPGVGPILDVRIEDGIVCATRSDGEKPVVYVATPNGWKRADEVGDNAMIAIKRQLAKMAQEIRTRRCPD